MISKPAYCPPPAPDLSIMVRISPNKTKKHAHTSYHSYDGQDLSHAAGIWKKKAKSDCRLNLMTKLLDMGLGFNELEHFNEALHLQIRSETLRKRLRDGKNPEKKVVREAMMFKTRDEQCKNREISTEMNETRRAIKAEYGENTRRVRGMMKMLIQVAQRERSEMTEKYRQKIKTLKAKHLVDKDEKINFVPPELTDYQDAEIFSRVKFDNIEKDDITIMKLGKTNVSREEELIIKKHPKFALLENLRIEDLELDLELGFGKFRYTVNGEIQEKRERRERRKRRGLEMKKMR